jgi:DinB superfamily
VNWTELLSGAVEENYRVADALMAMVTDDELNWKPATGKNWMTAGQLLLHMTTSCGFCCSAFLSGDWGMPECDDADKPAGADSHEMMLPPAEAWPTIDSVQAARDALAADKVFALKAIADAGEATLTGETVSAPWAPDHQRTYGEQFLGMVVHLQTHKSQLFYYLKLMGRDVNTMHLWGM